MRRADLLRLAFANLRRTRTRTLMTLVGVMIAVAALMALVAYGAGIQHAARTEFDALELYNTLRVTSRANPFTAPGAFGVRTAPSPAADSLPVVPLTDSLLAAIARLDGVLAAYPEVVFPVEIVVEGREAVASAEAVPMAFGRIPAYQPAVGQFFTASTDSALLVSPSMARRLGFDDPAQLVGRTVTVKTLALSLYSLAQNSLNVSLGLAPIPLQRVEHRMRVVGLLGEDGQPVSGFFRVLVPLERARNMQKVTFFSTLDLMLNNAGADGYPALRVQLERRDAEDAVRRAIEAEGVYVASFRDQFARLERLLLILDLALGIIGLIALLVATIGITNTMMMNVMERAREIGVMKAVGGDEGDVQRLFLVESGALGLLGGLAGLLAAGGLTGALQLAVEYYLHRLGLPPVDLFYTPLWLWTAVLAGAVLVSLVAGLLPARRAARIDPIDALRST